MSMPEDARRSIPSLDGMRAISVFVVILGHTKSGLLDRIPFSSPFRQAGQGVAVFFVISGFLITHLLLKELRHDGDIDIKRFYLRRTFRIFPPFYAFLVVIAVLASLHLVYTNWWSWLVAATYTWNYVPLPENWILGHSWSLCLEEQFYLLWPACMKCFSKRANLWIALTVILASPFSRVITYYAWPSMRTHMDMMLHTHLDTIMVGCLLSLMLDIKMWQRIMNAAMHPAAVAASLVFLVAVDGPLKAHLRGIYYMTAGISLENLAIASILLHAVFRHRSWLGKILNLKPLVHLGTISYSLYLWQQLFTGLYTHWFPLNILFIVACAELSYFFIERPSFRMRDRVQRWLERTKTSRYDTASLAS